MSHLKTIRFSIRCNPSNHYSHSCFIPSLDKVLALLHTSILLPPYFLLSTFNFLLPPSKSFVSLIHSASILSVLSRNHTPCPQAVLDESAFRSIISKRLYIKNTYSKQHFMQSFNPHRSSFNILFYLQPLALTGIRRTAPSKAF